MSVLYNSQKIIPAPLVTITKQVERKGDGTRLRSYYQITAKGTIVAWSGSPNSMGGFWTNAGYPPDESVGVDHRLAAINTKQGALCQLFATEGQWFEIIPNDGSITTKFQPRIKSIDFAEGIWFERCDYTIQMEADTIFFGSIECADDEGAGSIQVEESWTIEPADEYGRTYRLSHTASAEAHRLYNADGSVNQEGWERAKTAVVAKLGLDTSMISATNVLNLTGFAAFNQARSENIDEANGKFSVTETWLCFNPGDTPDGKGIGINAIEDFNVISRTSIDNGLTTVSVQGTITGLLERNTDFTVAVSRYTNASSKWTAISPYLLTRAQNFSGVALNPSAISTELSENPVTGVITYNYEYNNRCAITVEGARSQITTVIDNNPADIFAVIPVLDRAQGPILQAMGTVSERTRTVTVEIVMPMVYGACALLTKPNVTPVLLAYAPVATQVFVGQDQENWVIETGRYMRSVNYVYQ